MWRSVWEESLDEVAAVHARERAHNVGLVLLLVPEKVFALGQFLVGRVCRGDGLQRVGVESGVERLGRDGHGGGGEVLHLLEVEVEVLGDGGEFGHVLLGARGVRRDEVGDELLPQGILEVDAVEELLELLEEGERGFAHDVEHRVAGVLGSHLEPARDMEAYELLVELGIDLVDGGIAGAVHREVVAHTAANERLLDLGQGVDGVVDVEQGAVVGVEVGARLGVQARGACAALAAIQVDAVHAIHVGAGASEVGDVALEVVHLRHLLHLAHD